MKFGFIPGYACRADIFDPLLEHFKDHHCFEYPLDLMSEIDSVQKLCDLVVERDGEQLETCDVLVGHSLGGGIAMELSKLEQFRHTKVVLLDYFLKFPPPFFRCYCAEKTDQSIHDRVNEMLEEIKPRFNIQLIFSVSDYTPQRLADRHAVNQKKVLAIYGMRSEGSEKSVKDHLGYDESFDQYLDYIFVSDSAHFPMLEKPQEVIEILSGLSLAD